MDHLELLIGVLGYPYVSSPHWTIFQSPNSTPTLPEASFACSQLMVPKSEIHQINLELASLMMKREHFFKHITNCDAILAPYKKLPSELVSKIFRFIIPPHSAEFPLKRGQQNLRLQITQVCSKWRQIAFGIPLWNLYFRSSSKHTSSIELGASWWSQRSGSLLKLITISPSKPPLIPELDSPLIDKLVLPFLIVFGNSTCHFLLRISQKSCLFRQGHSTTWRMSSYCCVTRAPYRGQSQTQHFSFPRTFVRSLLSFLPIPGSHPICLGGS